MASFAIQAQFQSPPFDQLGEKYLFKQEIGRTQASSLFRVVEKANDRDIALKVFRRKFSADPRFALKFRNHLREIFKLQNEGLVSILDYGTSDGYYYIASEWVGGVDLSTYLAQVGVLGELQAIAIASQVCLSLEIVHRNGLLHQNLKPQNILLTFDGLVKLSDVGLAGLISESGLSRTHVMLGRYPYIAPEQVRGQVLTPGADIYSLGVVLFEMLTGQLPFDGRDVWEVLRMHVESEPPPLNQKFPNISGALAKVVQRTLEKSPEMRFQSAGEMNAALTVVSIEGFPARENFGSYSPLGVWGHFQYVIKQGTTFLQRKVPFRILGTSYPFGWVLLVQIIFSFLISFLFLIIVITLARLIW